MEISDMWMQKSEVFDEIFTKKQLSFSKKLNILT
jgi:hypothetical protein